MCAETAGAPLRASDVRAFVDAVRAGQARLEPAAEAQADAATAYGGGPHVAEPQVLALPAGVRWLEPGASSRLYVRPAYRVLLMLAMAFLDQEADADADAARCQVVVAGSVGVGRTAFLSFALAQLCAREERRADGAHAPVVVLDVAGVFCRVSPDGAVTDGSKAAGSFRDDLARRETVYLCDAAADEASWPLAVAARTIVAAAPVRRCYPAAAAAVTLVMPLWTTAELETCRAACFPHVSREHLVELVHLWGGTARYTLGVPLAASKLLLARGASSLALPAAARLVRDQGVASDAVWSDPDFSPAALALVHMEVGVDNLFKLESVRMCSSAACALMLQRLSDAQARAQLDAGDAQAPRAQLGAVFRRQVLQELANRAARA